MRRSLRKFVVPFAALLLLAGIAVTSSVRAADDPSNGTWKLNLAKSKFSPGPAPKTSTVTIKIENGTETYTSEGTNADGQPNNMSFTATVNGKDAPVTGNPFGDTIAIQHPAPNKFTATIKKDGKVTMTVHVVVAADGKSRTSTYSGKNADGKEVRDVMVYDKQ
jgi:hypothetical protein